MLKLTRNDVMSVLSHVVELATRTNNEGNKVSMYYVPLESLFTVVVYVPGTDAFGVMTNKAKEVLKGTAFTLDDVITVYNNL